MGDIIQGQFGGASSDSGGQTDKSTDGALKIIETCLSEIADAQDCLESMEVGEEGINTLFANTLSYHCEISMLIEERNLDLESVLKDCGTTAENFQQSFRRWAELGISPLWHLAVGVDKTNISGEHGMNVRDAVYCLELVLMSAYFAEISVADMMRYTGTTREQVLRKYERLKDILPPDNPLASDDSSDDYEP